MRHEFFDSYGNVIVDGDEIIIEANYNFQHLNGLLYKVRWDSVKGMFRYFALDGSTGDDFHGVHRFRKYENNLQTDKR